MSTLEDAKRRILALCPPDQMPIVDFELRMLATSLEADSLKFIHQHWRPIADERDKFRQLLAIAEAKPARSAKHTDDAEVRLTALTIDHANLKKQNTTLKEQNSLLQDRNDDLTAELIDLREKHKKLQADCDELLADTRPVRNAS